MACRSWKVVPRKRQVLHLLQLVPRRTELGAPQGDGGLCDTLWGRSGWYQGEPFSKACVTVGYFRVISSTDTWQQPVHAGFEVGTIMPALLLAAVIHDSLLFGNSLQLLITIDLILH